MDEFDVVVSGAGPGSGVVAGRCAADGGCRCQSPGADRGTRRLPDDAAGSRAQTGRRLR